MADLNLQEIHDLLIDVAHEAGQMMLAATPSYLSSGTKKNCKQPNPNHSKLADSNIHESILTSQ